MRLKFQSPPPGATMMGTEKERDSAISSCFKDTLRPSKCTPSAVGVTGMVSRYTWVGSREGISIGAKFGASCSPSEPTTCTIAEFAAVCGRTAMTTSKRLPTEGRCGRSNLTATAAVDLPMVTASTMPAVNSSGVGPRLTTGATEAGAGVTAGACFGSPWQAVNSTTATNVSLLPVVIRTYL